MACVLSDAKQTAMQELHKLAFHGTSERLFWLAIANPISVGILALWHSECRHIAKRVSATSFHHVVSDHYFYDQLCRPRWKLGGQKWAGDST